jgi:hypothetical protein
VALVTPVLGLCRSCRGQPTFGETAVGELLSSSPGSGSPRWSRQPAACAAGPSDGAGLLVIEPWRLLGHQPANSSACGMLHKSSPRQSGYGRSHHAPYVCKYYEVLHMQHYVGAPVLLHWRYGTVAPCRCYVKIFTTLRSATSSSSSTLVRERNPRVRSTRVRLRISS